MKTTRLLLLLLLLWSAPTAAQRADAGSTDGAPPDEATPDVVTPDVEAPAGEPPDEGPPDVGPPDAGGDADEAESDDVAEDEPAPDDREGDDRRAPPGEDAETPPECPSCPPCPAALEAAISGTPLGAPPVTGGGGAARDAGACLDDRLARLVDAKPFADVTLGAVVARLEDGATVFARHPTDALLPASTAKLVTAAAALHHLGPSWRWTTKVWSDAQRGGVIEGDIYVVGAGDPTLDTATLLDWAEAMRERGVTHVKGGVVADGSAFAPPALPPGFERKDTTATYRPAVAAFAVQRATLRAAIYPGDTVGAPCRVDLGIDAAYFDLENRCTTVGGGGSKPTLSSEAAGHRTRVVVGGQMGVTAGRILSYRRIEDPLLQAAHAFHAALRRVGIRVDGKARTGTLPKGRRLRIAHESAPLAVTLLEMNKASDNFYAEMTLKTLGGEVEGWPATWEGGQRAVAKFVATLKPRDGAGPLFDAAALGSEGWTFHNGSGLYDVDRISPALLARVVREATLAVESGAEFVASLPIAARDGTLARRARKTAAARRARGKTGSLDGVDALAGVVTARDGVRYVYAFLVNGSKHPHGTMRPALDRALAAIAEGCPTASAAR